VHRKLRAQHPRRIDSEPQGQPDPAAVAGTDLENLNAFREAFRILERRIELFTALPIASLDRLALGNKVRAIGKT
jgi:arsenate reductase